HLSDYLRQVSRRGSDARLWLQLVEGHQAESLREIREVPVVRDDLRALIRGELLLPLRELRVEPCVELAEIRAVRSGGFGIDLSEVSGDIAGDDLHVQRVDHEVGIAQPVDVSLRPVET